MLNLSNPELLRNGVLLNGQWRAALSGKTFAVNNPATQKEIGEVADCGSAETEEAVDAGHKAFKQWSSLTAKARSDHLLAWRELIMENADDLASIITAEQGKPLAEAKAEIIYAAGFLQWFAEEARRVYGEITPSYASDRRLYTIKQPIGLCAAITPWNFPIAMIARKIAPALAAGCTVIVKPAEQTPLTALAAAYLAQQAGIPAGVLQVITGDAAAIGKTLCAAPHVRQLSFTGSTEVGKILMRQSADTVKRVALELGGNAPFIIFDDADITAAVEGLLAAKFRNGGQTCICANRIYVQDSIYESVVERVAVHIKNLRVGEGTEIGVQVGPLIDQAQLAKVQAHVEDAIAHGAQCLVGGTLEERGGTFFSPTLLINVQEGMRVFKEETFGPVAAISKFKTEAEVICRANNSEFGLAAYFYARDIGRIHRVMEALEYGIVGVNTGLVSNETVPFGGYKQSGLGREGSHHGIEEYLEIKHVCMGGL